MANARMRKWLATRGSNLADFAWIPKDACWRPVKSYRTITRGKRKGWIQVELYYPEGRTRIIPAKYMRYKDDDAK